MTTEHNSRAGLRLVPVEPSPGSQMKHMGWLSELVHLDSGEVIREVFDRETKIEGPDKVRGFEWRAIQLWSTLPSGSPR